VIAWPLLDLSSIAICREAVEEDIREREQRVPGQKSLGSGRVAHLTDCGHRAVRCEFTHEYPRRLDRASSRNEPPLTPKSNDRGPLLLGRFIPSTLTAHIRTCGQYRECPSDPSQVVRAADDRDWRSNLGSLEKQGSEISRHPHASVKRGIRWKVTDAHSNRNSMKYGIGARVDNGRPGCKCLLGVAFELTTVP
jgi:hypothetical protein